MKKIICIIVFFSVLHINKIALASLQQELTLLSDNLIELEQKLNKQQPARDFLKLLSRAQETALAQEEIFNKMMYFLKGVDCQKEILSVYGGINRNYKKSLKIHDALTNLINEIYSMHDVSLFDDRVNKQVINLYNKIKNDWLNFAKVFHDFVKKNRNTPFFSKKIFINDKDQEIENFTLKAYVEELDLDISKANKELQSNLNEIIQEI